MRNGILTKLIVITTVLAIILPLFSIFIWSFTERWAWPDLLPQVFSTRALREIMDKPEELVKMFMSSIFISTVVGVLSVAIGLMTSRALVFYDFKGRKFVHFLTILPFMVPATVFAMGVQMTFIKLGINNTVFGVIVSHLICSLPYAVRLIMDGLSALGPKLEEQARVLGAGPIKAFFSTTFPLMTPIMLSSMSMAYIVSFSQYFLTLLIGGGRVKTFTVVMVPFLTGGDRSIACVYSVLFLAVTLAVFTLFEFIAKKYSENVDEAFYS